MGVQILTPGINPSTPRVGPDICAPEFSWAHTGLIYAAMNVGGVMRNVINRGSYRQPADDPADSTRIITRHGRGRGSFGTGLDAPNYEVLQGVGRFSTMLVSSNQSFGFNSAALSISFGAGNAVFMFYPYDPDGGNGARVWFTSNDMDQNSGALPADGTFHAHHFVARSPTDREMYGDGKSILTATASRSLSASVDTITLGSWFGTTHLFGGQIILACVWAGVAPNQSQIQQLSDDWFGPFRPEIRTIGKAPAVAGVPGDDYGFLPELGEPQPDLVTVYA